MAGKETNSVAQVYDLISNLVSPGTHFVVRGNGDQVKVDSLKGKKVALYFSAKHCSFWDRCEQELAEAYNELLPTNDFEVLCISGYEDRDSFDEYLAKKPWLAVPFSDSETRDHFHELFGVVGGKHSLFIIDENGKVVTNNGFHIIGEYGAEGYPFSPERIKYLEEYLKDQEEATKRNQTLKSILAFVGRDYVLAADGKKVPVSELVGKTVCLYFQSNNCPDSDECPAFTRHLVRVYEKLREKGHNFEIVMIPDDIDYEPYNLPWNYLPFKRRNYFRLRNYCTAVCCPFLFIIGPDGKTLHSRHECMEPKISKYGSQAFPFTRERFLELEEMNKAKQEAQTLESVLTLGEEDFLIGKSGAKIQVSELRGYNILLYFDNNNHTICCGSKLGGDNSCRYVSVLLPKLIETYNAIKAKDDAFEVIFISSDEDQSSFDEFFSRMPWLAIPFGDERLQCLRRRHGLMLFCLPYLVAMDPTGKTIGYPQDSIMAHGADAYPFNNQRRKELQMEVFLRL